MELLKRLTTIDKIIMAVYVLTMIWCLALCIILPIKG